MTLKHIYKVKKKKSTYIVSITFFSIQYGISQKHYLMFLIGLSFDGRKFDWILIVLFFEKLDLEAYPKKEEWINT